jgi:serine/threonine protein kinase
MPWGTAGYVPPEWLNEPGDGSRKSEDLYALGATLYQLLTNRIPEATAPPVRIGSLRRRVPPGARKIIHRLLDPDPLARPDTGVVARDLRSAYLEVVTGA